MADDFVDLKPIAPQGEDKVLFQVAVNAILKIEGDDRVKAMPLHEVPLEMCRQELYSNEVEVRSQFLSALKEYRVRGLSVAEIEAEEQRLREDYAFYEGDTKVDLFTKVYGEPANCRFAEVLAKICHQWRSWMQDEEPITGPRLTAFCRSLLPSSSTSLRDIERIPLPGMDEVAPQSATGEKAKEPEKAGRKAAVAGDKTLDPDAQGVTEVDVELLDHLNGSIADEEQALALARLGTRYQGAIPAEALATVKGLETAPKQERALRMVSDFYQQAATKAG
jgi:hypothetical protein